MDMFMDKLAQKLNAQEIIKANTAADAAELNRLKGQIEEYDKCLEKLQQLIESGTAKMGVASRESETEIHRLVEESLNKIREIQQAPTGLEKLDDIEQQLTVMNGTLAGSLGEIHDKLEEKPEDGLEERFAALDENVHKECVKVYRNVQAVLLEESGKQSEALANAASSVEPLKGKLGAVFGISLAALIISLAGVALQVLNILGIF